MITSVPVQEILSLLPHGVQLEIQRRNGKWSWRVKNPAYGKPTWTGSFATKQEAAAHAVDQMLHE